MMVGMPILVVVDELERTAFQCERSKTERTFRCVAS